MNILETMNMFLKIIDFCNKIKSSKYLLIYFKYLNVLKTILSIDVI